MNNRSENTIPYSFTSSDGRPRSGPSRSHSSFPQRPSEKAHSDGQKTHSRSVSSLIWVLPGTNVAVSATKRLLSGAVKPIFFINAGCHGAFGGDTRNHTRGDGAAFVQDHAKADALLPEEFRGRHHAVAAFLAAFFYYSTKSDKCNGRMTRG